MDALTKLEVARATVKEGNRLMRYSQTMGWQDDIMVFVERLDAMSRLLAAAKELVAEAEAEEGALPKVRITPSGQRNPGSGFVIAAAHPFIDDGDDMCKVCCATRDHEVHTTPPAERPVGATEKRSEGASTRWHRFRFISGRWSDWHESTGCDQGQVPDDDNQFHTGPSPPAAASESPRADEGRCIASFLVADDTDVPKACDGPRWSWRHPFTLPERQNMSAHEFAPAKMDAKQTFSPAEGDGLPNTAKEI